MAMKAEYDLLHCVCNAFSCNVSLNIALHSIRKILLAHSTVHAFK